MADEKKLYVPGQAGEKAEEEEIPYDLPGDEDDSETEVHEILAMFLVVLDEDGNAQAITDPQKHVHKFKVVREVEPQDVHRACTQIANDLNVIRITESVVVNMMQASQQIQKVAQQQREAQQIKSMLSKGGHLGKGGIPRV